RGLIVVAIGARLLRELGEVTRSLACISLGERDRRKRRIGGGKPWPATERLPCELERVEEPRRARRRERENPLEQLRLLGSTGGKQRAMAAHRFFDVTVAQLMIGRVHQVVSGGERERTGPDPDVAGAAATG